MEQYAFHGEDFQVTKEENIRKFLSAIRNGNDLTGIKAGKINNPKIRYRHYLICKLDFKSDML